MRGDVTLLTGESDPAAEAGALAIPLVTLGAVLTLAAQTAVRPIEVHSAV